MRRRTQLDALRAIAVCAVLVHHFLPVNRIIPEDFLTLGLLAVRLFFVLSGYLITGILLRSRALGFEFSIKRFYIRRALRILPIYYLTVIVLSLCSASVERFIWWHLFYLSNVAGTLHPDSQALTGHLWSLSVEEQFYLLWPLAILLLPRRVIPWFIGGIVAFGVAWKTAVAFTLGVDSIGATLMPACLDSLGIGAALAYVESEAPRKREQLLRYALLAGTAILAIQTYCYATNHALRYFWSTEYLAVSLIFVWLVGHASTGFRGIVGKAMEAKPLVYIGQISYGVYIYHFFMPALIIYCVKALGLPKPSVLTAFFMATALTFFAAALSWKFIERPLNSLKDHIRISKHRRVATLWPA